MFKNYFYLQRAVSELLPILQNVQVTECYSQEKDKLYFAIPSTEFPFRHLIISTNSTLPFLQIRDTHHKAKKNTVAFFSKYLPSNIINIQIAKNDRVIKFTFAKHCIYFLLRGNKSNIILIDEKNNILAFKHPNNSYLSFLDELNSYEFNTPFKLQASENLDFHEAEYSALKKHFNFIDKVFFQEIKSRLDEKYTPLDIIEQINATIIKIMTDNITVFFDDFEGKSYFVPESFVVVTSATNVTSAANYNQAIQNLFRIKFKKERVKSLNNQLQKYFIRELDRLAHKLNNLSGRISKGSKDLEYYKKGNLLLTNLTLIKKGLKEILLSDYETGKEVLIKLNDKIPPNKNVDKYFEKAKDEKINFQKSKELFVIAEKKYESLLNLKTQFEDSTTIEELENLESVLKLNKKNKTKNKMTDNLKFRHYLIDNQYHVFVGKDSKSNDLLSIKFAKQNDYWFHARGLPGSHVVLRVENTKEGIPKNIIKNAASIAGFFSKAKTANVAPVSYTFAKYVYKKKGMEPGKVMISKEKVLLVKPEIPKNSEIVIDD